MRKTIGTILATRCIMSGYTLLHNDRDFNPFVDHLGLRVVLLKSRGDDDSLLAKLYHGFRMRLTETVRSEEAVVDSDSGLLRYGQALNSVLNLK